jgi:hypothetical protein
MLLLKWKSPTFRTERTTFLTFSERPFLDLQLSWGSSSTQHLLSNSYIERHPLLRGQPLKTCRRPVMLAMAMPADPSGRCTTWGTSVVLLHSASKTNFLNLFYWYTIFPLPSFPPPPPTFFGLFSEIFTHMQFMVMRYSSCISFSVADPDPSDPYVFGPPESGSGSINQRYGSGSGSFYHQSKIVIITLIPTAL